MTTLQLEAPFTPMRRQWDFARACVDEQAEEILFAGSIRGGKTQACSRAVVEWALEVPQSIHLVARSTYRELEDSTKKVILRGDGALPPILHPELIRDVRAGDNKVVLRNGSEILFRSLEEQNIGKVLNLTLASIFVDQIEELDSGPAGERLYDTLIGRLSDPRGPRKLVAAANPGPTTHWLYRRFVDLRSKQPQTRYVHVKLTDNADVLPAEYVERMLRTKDTRPHWYRCYVLGEWGSFEGAAYPEFQTDIHIIRPFPVDPCWDRLEGMDFGRNNPTSWLVFAVDYDGNLIVFDEYHQPGLVREHATEIWKRRRDRGWWAKDNHGRLISVPCYADPSIKNRYGISDPTGRELSVEIEFSDYEIAFSPGQNDRRAGYGRVAELLHPDPDRYFPEWHPRTGEKGSPRLFVFEHCERVIEALRNAPVKAEGKDAQEIIDPDWESQHGHASAALRYACLSRPAPSEPDTSRTTKPAETKRELYTRMLHGEDPEDMGWDPDKLGWDTRYLNGYEDGYPARF